MDFKIENNTPYKRIYKRRKNNVPALPLDQMKKDQSILLDTKYNNTIYQRWYTRIKKQIGEDMSHFRIGKDKQGTRIWRLDDKAAA